MPKMAGVVVKVLRCQLAAGTEHRKKLFQASKQTQSSVIFNTNADVFKVPLQRKHHSPRQKRMVVA
jgi:hypothetical protein